MCSRLCQAAGNTIYHHYFVSYQLMSCSSFYPTSFFDGFHWNRSKSCQISRRTSNTHEAHVASMELSNININGCADAHYRYTMAPLDVKSDNRSKQRRTMIANVAQVSHQLRRSPELLTTYLAGNATTALCDHSSGQPIWYLKGHYDKAPLQTRVSEFCQELVVCPKCGDCGTRLYATVHGSKKRPDRKVHIDCGACGACQELHRVEPKLAKLIPALEKQSKPKKKKKKPKEANEVKEELDDSVEWLPDTQVVPATQRGESFSESMASLWSLTTANATAVSSASTQQHESQPEVSSVAQTTEGPIGMSSCAQSVQQQVHQAFKGLSKSKLIIRATKSLCPELAAELSQHEVLALLTQLPDNVAKHAALVLKVLYDHDVLDEQTITKWHQTADQSVLAVSKAKAFVDWLASAEDE